MNLAHWRMARRNLARNKRRNAATGTAIALGFAALLALGGYLHRTQNYLRAYTLYASRVGHISIYKPNGLDLFSSKPKKYSFDEREQEIIRSVLATDANIDLAGPQLNGSGLIGNGCRTLPFLATGIDPDLDHRLRDNAEARHWLPTVSAFAKGRGLWDYPEDVGAIAVSTGLARLLQKTKVYDEIPKDQKITVVVDCLGASAKAQIAADANIQLAAGSWTGMMAAQDGEVVANYNTGVTETNNASILTSLRYLQRLYDTPNVGLFSIWLKEGVDVSSEMKTLKDALTAKGLAADFYEWSDEAVAPFYTGTMQFLYTMVGFITVVLSTVIIFSVFNSATMTVIERSQEIGMMRALGFTRGLTRQLFVMEMLLLSLLSLAGGGIVGALGIALVNSLDIRINPPGVAGGLLLQLLPSGLIIVGSGGLILVLAVLTTLLAVRSVAGRQVADLLAGTNR